MYMLLVALSTKDSFFSPQKSLGNNRDDPKLFRTDRDGKAKSGLLCENIVSVEQLIRKRNIVDTEISGRLGSGKQECMIEKCMQNYYYTLR